MNREALTDRLGYRFNDTSLLEQALTHSSFAAETAEASDNERLEFLGDAVLGLAITTKLYADYPALPEGMMAKVRAAVVNEKSLATAARKLDLGLHLRIGRGEDGSGGRDKDSILSDAFEALLGAVYLDSSYSETEAVVVSMLGDSVDHHATDPGGSDFKTRLQELLAQKGIRPRYEATSRGPDHARVYTVSLFVEDEPVAEGKGKSKKIAEQDAAQTALAGLESDGA